MIFVIFLECVKEVFVMRGEDEVLEEKEYLGKVTGEEK
jgi:hypothetical protein